MTKESPDSPAPSASHEPSRPVEIEVGIVRSVRYFRLMLVGGVIGLVVMAAFTLTRPLQDGADYTLTQATGFMALVGAVLGLLLGAVLGLILGQIAKKKRGSGVAVQSDVQ